MGALDTAIDGALDPLDGAIDGVVGDKRKANVYNAVQQNPDEFAQATQLSRSTGLPAPVVARNLPQVKQRADLDALDKVLDQSPAVRKAMDDPTFAILARDDTETLAEIGRTADRRAGGVIGGPAFVRKEWKAPPPTMLDEISRQVSGSTRALTAGLLTDFNAAAWGIAEGGANLVGADTLGGFFNEQRKSQEAMGKAIQGDYGSQGVIEGGVASGFRSFGNMLPATVASVLTGNPAFMLGSGATTAGGQSVGKGLDKGLEPWRALAYGAEDAVAEYATEKLPVGRLFKDLKAGTPFFKLLGMQMATEVPTELAATTWQNFNEWANLNPEKSFEDYANQLGPDLAQTVIATVTQTILSAGMAKGASKLAQGVYNNQQKAEAATTEAETLAQLSQLAAASKLRERDPQTFEQYVETAAPGQEVYLDARTLQQSGVDLAALAQASPAVAAHLTEALATGGDIVLPVSEYAARLAGTDLDTALLPHLRASEDALSQDEAQRFYQGQAEEFKKAAAKVMEDKATDDAWQASAKAVETQLLDQLQQTNRFTPDVNSAYAALMRDFYVATAARTGTTPEAMFAQYPLRVAAQAVEGGRVLDQPAPAQGPISKLFQSVTNLLKGGDPSGKEGQGRRQEVLTDGGAAPLDMGQFFQGQKAVDQTETPEFKRWFGDSKVVDAEGKPLVVYHGTASTDIMEFLPRDEGGDTNTARSMQVVEWFRKLKTENGRMGYMNFRSGTFFSPDPDYAGNYTGEGGGVMYPVYIKAENPVYFDQRTGVVTGVDATKTPDALIMRDGDQINEVAVIDPTQIKSAIGNRGTFDPNDPNILAQSNRAEISFGADITQQPSVITLFNNADLSSFLHEMGHFQLEVLAHLASQPNAPAEIVQDMEAVLKWFGITGGSSVEGGDTSGSLGQGPTQAITPEDIKTNPSAERLLAMLRKSEGGALRYVVDDRGNFHFWDAFKAVHKDGSEAAGVSYDYTRRGTVKLTPEGLARFDYADLGVRTEELQRYMVGDNTLFYAPGHGEVTGAEMAALLGEEADTLLRNLLAQGGDEGTRGPLPQRRTALEVWQAMSLEEKRPYHEQFARGFEAYLFEGKAPSQELVGIFQRFRAWLVSVYKSIKALNVEISDDIRGVFDRLVATDEAIKAAEAARAYTPLFPDDPEAQALAAKATQDATDELQRRSLRDMRWLDNARGRILKQMQADAKAKRKAVEAEVRAEVRAQPIYAARAALKDGVKISIEGLEELYAGDGDRYALLDWKPLVDQRLAGKEGMHPDQAAEAFGFTSGDQLVKALLSAEPEASVVEGMTDQRVLERYGDISSPDTLARAVDEAIHNEARARFVAAELKALNKAAGPVRAISKAAKDFADATVARKKVREIKPARHAAAETRAAKAAEKALAAGDTVLAADEKRNQLIQNYTTRASYDALTEIDKALRYFAKLDSESTRKNLDAEYLDQIDALLERFDFRKSITNKDAKKRTTLLEWVQGQRDEGLEPDIPPELLAEAMRKPYKEMTLEELRGLIDTVKQIDHLGRLKRKLLTAKDEREFKAIRDEIAASIVEHAKGVRDLRTRNLTSDALKDAGARFLAMHRKMASVSREMDGFKDGGPMWEYLIRSMNDAGNRESGMRADATARLHALVKPLLASGKMGGKGIYFESLGGSFNREERIAIALNLGNAGNTQRLLDGEGWTMARLRPLLDTITAEEADFVQSIWDFFESYRPEIAAKERRIYGKEPAWVEPVPLMLGGKELKGGYYPVKYDRARSERAAAHEDAESAKAQMKGAYTSATTRRSFTKTRAEEVTGRPLLYSFAGIYQGTNEVVHDLSWHEWLIDANRLVRSLSGVISTHYGDETRDLFKKAIEDIAVGDFPAQNVFERGINHLRMGATVAGLGWNFSTALLQPFGLTQSMVRIGPAWVVKGLSQWIKSPIDTGNDVRERSAFMRDRARTMQREINEIQNQVRGSKLDPVRATFFLMIQKMQMVADMPTWLGAYEKAIAEGNAEDRAVALADQAVTDAQGGGQTKDLAQIQRGGPLLKLWTNFYSFFNTTYNLAVEKTKEKGSNPKLYPSLAMDYLLLFVIPCAMVTLVKAVLSGDADDEDELVKKLAADQISYLLGTMVGLRELSAAMQKLAGVEQFKSSYGGPAGLRMFQEVDKLSTQMAQGDVDAALLKAINNTAGNLLHYPSGQINRTAGGVAAMVEGKTDNPMAVLLGPPPKR